MLGDTSTYPLHMDDFHSLYGRYPDVSVCDAGYGSEENYLYAFRHGIETFIKYNYFHNEETDGGAMWICGSYANFVL